MNARSSKSKGWPFRDSSMDNEDNVAMNQRMVGQLLKRKTEIANLPLEESRSLIGLGIEVSQSREENAGLSLKEAAKKGGLDPAFLAIVESGKAIPDEITADVLRSLSRGVKAEARHLESAMAVQTSRHQTDAAGQIVSFLVSLCAPAFLNRATAYKSMVASPASDENPDQRSADVFGVVDDEDARVSYRLAGFAPIAFQFYDYQNPDVPKTDWSVSVRCGLEELFSGKTDSRGIFTFPSDLEDFPENSHMFFSKPS